MLPIFPINKPFLDICMENLSLNISISSPSFLKKGSFDSLANIFNNFSSASISIFACKIKYVFKSFDKENCKKPLGIKVPFVFQFFIEVAIVSGLTSEN